MKSSAQSLGHDQQTKLKHWLSSNKLRKELNLILLLTRDGMMSSMRQSKFTKVKKINSTSIHKWMEPSLRQLNKHYLNLDLASKLTPFFPLKNRISSSSLSQLTTFKDSKRKLWLVTHIKPTIAMETQIKILLVFIHLSKLNQVT